MRKNLDTNVKEMIVALEKASKKNKKEYFRSVAKVLDTPSRHNPVINLSKLDRLAKDEKAVFVVCGKLLGSGNITKKVEVYAYKCSDLAKKKLESVGSKVKTLNNLVADVPKNVILLK